jgi:dsDNA-binding SOS-regulon protein
MARNTADRYSGMVDLAEDLRAYLEGRVVRAYERGLFAEVRKWILRNRALAGTIIARPS